MNTPPPTPDPADRALGSQLAALLHQQSDLPAQRIQALLPDLLGQDQGLINPLRDLVGRPAFLQLLRRRDRAASRQLRHTLLEELSYTYSPRMMVRLAAVLDGLLPASAPSPSHSPSSAAAQSAAAPPRQAAPPPPLATAPAELRGRRPLPTHAQTRVRHEPPGRPGLLPLLGLTAAIALVSGTVFAVLRSDGLCPSLGICLSGEGRGERGSIEVALTQGEAAATTLESAASLEELNSGVERLNEALLKLVSRRLNGRQEERRLRLQAAADGAQQRLRQERRAEDHLREAGRLIDRLERGGVDDDRRFDLIQEARTSLASVPGDSFAASAALGLQQRLETVRSKPSEPAKTTGTTPDGETSPEPPATGSGAPAPPPPPLPAPPSTPATPAPQPPVDGTPAPPTEPATP
ncbi:MAG: hypothetical protein ACKO25_08810 [Cyanobium sp.]